MVTYDADFQVKADEVANLIKQELSTDNKVYDLKDWLSLVAIEYPLEPCLKSQLKAHDLWMVNFVRTLGETCLKDWGRDLRKVKGDKYYLCRPGEVSGHIEDDVHKRTKNAVKKFHRKYRIVNRTLLSSKEQQELNTTQTRTGFIELALNQARGDRIEQERKRKELEQRPTQQMPCMPFGIVAKE